jgi:hypothetical protein
MILYYHHACDEIKAGDKRMPAIEPAGGLDAL